MSAYRDGDKIVILMPARTSKAEEQRLITEMVERVTRREAKMASTGPRAGDDQLLSRARWLSEAYLEGRPQPVSVRWVRNMHHRWGSCTPADRTIRLSHRLHSTPSWVIDYVLVHELSHLLEPGHDRAFWAWAERYPRTERARGFLEGVAVAAQLPELSDCDSPELDCGPADSSGLPGRLAAFGSSAPAAPDDPALPAGLDGSVSAAGGLAPASGDGGASAPALGGVSVRSSACSAAGLKLARSGSSNSGIRMS